MAIARVLGFTTVIFFKIPYLRLSYKSSLIFVYVDDEEDLVKGNEGVVNFIVDYLARLLAVACIPE
jgi:uncharacterized protein (DUF1499 family)